MDNREGPNNTRQRGNTPEPPQVNIHPPTSPTQASASPATPSQNSAGLYRVTSRPNLNRQSTIRIRRLPSNLQLTIEDGRAETTGRRRSSSAPQRPQTTTPRIELTRQATADQMEPVVEENSHSVPTSPQDLVPPLPAGRTVGRMRSVSNAARSRLGGLQRIRSSMAAPTTQGHEYDSDVVNMLDVIGS
jgi:hypothetical protein